MKRLTLAFALLFVLFPLGTSFAGQSKSAKNFCKIRPFASGNGILPTLTATSLTLSLAKGISSLNMYLEYRRQNKAHSLQGRTTALGRAQAMKHFAAWKPLAYFFKVMIPFMKTHNRFAAKIQRYAGNPSAFGQMIRDSSALKWKGRYEKLKKIRLAWMALVSVPSTALLASTLAVCKEVELFSAKVCVKSKCSIDNDPDNSIEEYDLYGERTNMCATDAQRASQMLRYSNQQQGNVNRAYNDVKKLNDFSKKYGSKLRSINRALNPILRNAEKALKQYKKVNKIIDPVYVAFKKLGKVMKKRICFVGKCMKVEKAIKKVGKVAKKLQKPLNAVLKKTLDPVIKKLVKKVPMLPNPAKLQKLFNALNKFNAVKNLYKDLLVLTKLPFSTHQRNFQAIQRKIAAIQRSR